GFSGIKIDPSPGGTISEKETEEVNGVHLEQAEKKATSDRLEAIEKDRKQADQQVETLIKRRERLKNIKKESEQEVKEVPIVEPDERENAPLWQRIIAENKKRTTVKNRLNQKRPAEEVLFYEPYDAPGVSQLMQKQKTFGPKLRQMVEHRQRVKVTCYKYNDEFYKSCMRDFMRKTERWANSPKKIARDLRNREIFERAFPEMKRAREEKERAGRTDRVSMRAQEDEQAANNEK
ncbi:unnamed protein product, partial [Cylicostephanus goldi]